MTGIHRLSAHEVDNRQLLTERLDVSAFYNTTIVTAVRRFFGSRRWQAHLSIFDRCRAVVVGAGGFVRL
jgi:hypothetical protein